MIAEKKTALVDLIQSSGYPVLVEVVEELVKSFEKKVLTIDVRSTEKDEFFYMKCEAQGARKLAFALETYLKKLRVAASQADVHT